VLLDGCGQVTMTSTEALSCLLVCSIHRVSTCLLACQNFTPREEAAGEDGEEATGPDAAVLAMSWKRKLYHHRAKETVTAPRGTRGLRIVNKIRSTPSAADIIIPSDEYLFFCFM